MQITTDMSGVVLPGELAVRLTGGSHGSGGDLVPVDASAALGVDVAFDQLVVSQAEAVIGAQQASSSFDIDLPDELLERVAAISLKAHQELGCRDFSRVDWRVDVDHVEPYLLEVNVIPGLTSHSLLPKAAEHAGLSMPALCQKIVDSALKRKFSKHSK